MELIQTIERDLEIVPSGNFNFKRRKYACFKAAEIVNGRVLELETGNKYGIYISSPLATVVYKMLIKNNSLNFPDNSSDNVVCFNTIGDIEIEPEFISEISRILVPGGKVIFTVPNKKTNSNEDTYTKDNYSSKEFESMLKYSFPHVESYGIFGNEIATDYYIQRDRNTEKSKRSNLSRPEKLWKNLNNIIFNKSYRQLFNINPAFTGNVNINDLYMDRLKNSKDICFDLFVWHFNKHNKFNKNNSKFVNPFNRNIRK